jgi:flagellar motor protein MotB
VRVLTPLRAAVICVALVASPATGQPVLPGMAPPSLYEEADPWATNPDIVNLQSGGVAVHDTVFAGEETLLEPLVATGVVVRDNARAVARLTLQFENPASGTEGVIWCTGFLVAPDLLLTARHCVVSPSPAVRFRRGYAMFEYFRRSAPGDEQIRVDIADVVEESRALDYALLRLAEENEFIQPLRIGRDSVRSQTQRLYIVHHPKTLPTRVTRFGCRVQAEDGMAPGTFAHSCDTYDSSSGSPVFAVDTDAVVGLHNAGRGVMSEFNQAVDLSAIIRASPLLSARVREEYPLFFVEDRPPLAAVYFDWDRTDLTPHAQVIVDDLVVRLNAADGLIYLIGHADGSNNAAYGVRVAERRARTVADALVARGVDGGRIVIESKGTFDAVRAGSFGRDPDWRRVDIRLADGSA